MTDIATDLNATIASAVNARIEAAVLEALSGDEVIGRYVTAALYQPIEVGSGYSKRKTTFLKETLDGAIRDATKAAVASILATERPLIEDEVRKALRRGVAKMAEGIASSLADNAANGYGVTVELKLPGERY